MRYITNVGGMYNLVQACLASVGGVYFKTTLETVISCIEFMYMHMYMYMYMYIYIFCMQLYNPAMMGTYARCLIPNYI